MPARSIKLVPYLLALVSFTHIMDTMIVMPLGDIFIREFEITAFQFTVIVSSYAVGAFLSSLVGSLYIDRFDRKRALQVIYIGFTVGTILCAFTPNYVTLVATRFVTGLFGGVIGTLALAIVSDLFEFKERGAAVGILMTAFSAASALGVPLGLYLADLYNWHAPFLAVGGMGIALSIVIQLYMPPIDGHLRLYDDDPELLSVPVAKPRLFDGLRAMSRDRNQLLALATGGVLVVGHMLIIPFITPYMTRNVGLEQSMITWVYFVGGLLTVFTAPVFGRMTDRIGALRTFIITMSAACAVVLILTNLPEVAVPVALVVTSLFFVFGSGRMIAPNTLITAAVGPEGRGAFMSIKSALQQLAIGLASFASGLIVIIDERTGLVEYYWVVGILSVVIGLLVIPMAARLKVVG